MYIWIWKCKDLRILKMKEKGRGPTWLQDLLCLCLWLLQAQGTDRPHVALFTGHQRGLVSSLPSVRLWLCGWILTNGTWEEMSRVASRHGHQLPSLSLHRPAEDPREHSKMEAA